jgi:uncharacterized repeat protein (TIGR01451 family)
MLSLLRSLFAASDRRRRPIRDWTWTDGDRLWAESLEERRVLAAVDLAISVTDGRDAYTGGEEAIYTVIVTNAGPETAVGARVVAALPTGMPAATWVAKSSAAATAAESGSSSGGMAIDESVTLPAGGAVIYTLRGTVDEDAVGLLTLSASVSAAVGDADANLDDNTATETNFRPLLAAGTDLDAASTPTVSMIDPSTGGLVRSFLAYEAGFRGGVQTAVTDVDDDGALEVITASGPGRVAELRVFELDGTEREDFRWRPFGNGFYGGLSLAVADFDGDGTDDYAVSQAMGTGQVLVHRGLAGAAGWETTPWRQFNPFGAGHRGGTTLAAADLGSFAGGVVIAAGTPDGRAELLVTNGPGATPLIDTLDLSTGVNRVRRISPAGFGTLGGVNISAGRYDTDAIADILVAGGRRSTGTIAVYSGSVTGSVQPLASFAAFGGLGSLPEPTYASGVDTTGDGRIDTIFGSLGGGSTGRQRLIDRATNSITDGTVVTRGPLARASQVMGPRVAQTVGPQELSTVTTASGLQYVDLQVGTGTVATAGQEVSVQYVGSRQNGAVFDNSWTRGTPFSFTLGAGQVIAGWDEGVAGMRVGGRRMLIIPANLAYGDDPSTGRPTGTLVFDVQLLSASLVRPPLDRPPLTPN